MRDPRQRSGVNMPRRRAALRSTNIRRVCPRAAASECQRDDNAAHDARYARQHGVIAFENVRTCCALLQQRAVRYAEVIRQARYSGRAGMMRAAREYECAAQRNDGAAAICRGVRQELEDNGLIRTAYVHAEVLPLMKNRDRFIRRGPPQYDDSFFFARPI